MDYKEAIGIDGANVYLGGQEILHDINWHVKAGERCFVLGANGAGKTTLVLALLNETDYTGTIEFCSNRRPRIGYVPQHLAFDRGMPLTVIEFIAAFHQKLPLCFGIRKDLKKKLHELLGETGCLHLENRPLGALSGGELQRVMLAGALSQEPELLILDEPASGIDFKGGEVCCELLERFRKAFGFTQLMVTHDLNTVMAHATHVICLNRTLIAEGEPHTVLSDKVLAKAFGPHVGCSCGKDHSKNG